MTSADHVAVQPHMPLTEGVDRKGGDVPYEYTAFMSLHREIPIRFYQQGADGDLHAFEIPENKWDALDESHQWLLYHWCRCYMFAFNEGREAGIRTNF